MKTHNWSRTLDGDYTLELGIGTFAIVRDWVTTDGLQMVKGWVLWTNSPYHTSCTEHRTLAAAKAAVGL